LLFAVGFCICGISVDTLKKQLNPWYFLYFSITYFS
jgi:hypothetical protein